MRNETYHKKLKIARDRVQWNLEEEALAKRHSELRDIL